jgi:hypothetical protein
MQEPDWPPFCECKYDEVHDRMDREDCLLHCDIEEEISPPLREPDHAQETGHNRKARQGERSMIKKPRPRRKHAKVISIERAAFKTSAGLRVIASDAVTHRMIVAIGGERFAYDVTARITELPPTTGDQPAPLMPLKKRKRE